MSADDRRTGGVADPARDALDDKLDRIPQPARSVRKDLVRKVKVGANVPVFVLEYLLGEVLRHRRTSRPNPDGPPGGLSTPLAETSSGPTRRQKAQSLVKETGRTPFIDKVKVRYLADDDKHWAEWSNFGHKFVHVPNTTVREYDRLLMGGVWAAGRDPPPVRRRGKGKAEPLLDRRSEADSGASFDLDEYRTPPGPSSPRTSGSTSAPPQHRDGADRILSRRLKLFFLMRLVPLCEHNYNLVELGPRGTGKSYAYQELSPYAILLTGPTPWRTSSSTWHGQDGARRHLGRVAFDEVADLQKMPKEVVTTLKTYCESGTFARGKESTVGDGLPRHVREHEPAGRGDGAVVAPLHRRCRT